MKTTLHDLLQADGPIIADGGMGSMLFGMGLSRGASPEGWNVEEPEKVRRVHRQYIEAGAQIILTNTFGGSRILLELHGLGDRAVELNTAAAKNARAEADAAARPVIVAGSMGPTGQMLAPLGTLEFETAVDVFAEQARALVDGGVDVLWIETMSDLEEVRAAVLGAQQAAPNFPLVTTMTFDRKGRTMMGVTPEKAVETIQEFNVAALGANCGNGPDEIEAVITKMHGVGPALNLVAKANAGLPKMENGGAVYDATPADMAGYAVRVRAAGARIVGACCGSTPAHIQAIAEALQVK